MSGIASEHAMALRARLALSEHEKARDARRAQMANQLVSQLTQAGTKALDVGASAHKRAQDQKTAADRFEKKLAIEQEELELKKKKQEADKKAKEKKLTLEEQKHADAVAAKEGDVERKRLEANRMQAKPGFYSQVKQRAQAIPAEEGQETNLLDVAKSLLGEAAEGQTDAAILGMLEESRIAEEGMTAKAEDRQRSISQEKAVTQKEAQFIQKIGAGVRDGVEILGLIEKVGPEQVEELRSLKEIAHARKLPLSVPWSKAAAVALDLSGKGATFGASGEASKSFQKQIGEWDKAQAADAAMDKLLDRAVANHQAVKNGKPAPYKDAPVISPETRILVDKSRNFAARRVAEILVGQGVVTDRDVDRTSLPNIFGDPQVFSTQIRDITKKRAQEFGIYAENLGSRRDLASAPKLNEYIQGIAGSQVGPGAVGVGEQAAAQHAAGGSRSLSVDRHVRPDFADGSPPVGAGRIEDLGPHIIKGAEEMTATLGKQAMGQATKAGKAAGESLPGEVYGEPGRVFGEVRSDSKSNAERELRSSLEDDLGVSAKTLNSVDIEGVVRRAEQLEAQGQLSGNTASKLAAFKQAIQKRKLDEKKPERSALDAWVYGDGVSGGNSEKAASAPPANAGGFMRTPDPAQSAAYTKDFARRNEKTFESLFPGASPVEIKRKVLVRKGLIGAEDANKLTPEEVRLKFAEARILGDLN